LNRDRYGKEKGNEAEGVIRQKTGTGSPGQPALILFSLTLVSTVAYNYAVR